MSKLISKQTMISRGTRNMCDALKVDVASHSLHVAIHFNRTSYIYSRGNHHWIFRMTVEVLEFKREDWRNAAKTLCKIA